MNPIHVAVASTVDNSVLVEFAQDGRVGSHIEVARLHVATAGRAVVSALEIADLPDPAVRLSVVAALQIARAPVDAVSAYRTAVVPAFDVADAFDGHALRVTVISAAEVAVSFVVLALRGAVRAFVSRAPTAGQCGEPRPRTRVSLRGGRLHPV